MEIGLFHISSICADIITVQFHFVITVVVMEVDLKPKKA